MATERLTLACLNEPQNIGCRMFKGEGTGSRKCTYNNEMKLTIKKRCMAMILGIVVNKERVLYLISQ